MPSHQPTLLDEAGFFHWTALQVARWGGGRGRRLLPLIVLLGAPIAAVFANDGAALLLTPIVVAILLQLEFPAPAALAFIFATGFVADNTSLPLVISNLGNIAQGSVQATGRAVTDPRRSGGDVNSGSNTTLSCSFGSVRAITATTVSVSLGL